MYVYSLPLYLYNLYIYIEREREVHTCTYNTDMILVWGNQNIIHLSALITGGHDMGKT